MNKYKYFGFVKIEVGEVYEHFVATDFNDAQKTLLARVKRKYLAHLKKLGLDDKASFKVESLHQGEYTGRDD